MKYEGFKWNDLQHLSIHWYTCSLCEFLAGISGDELSHPFSADGVIAVVFKHRGYDNASTTSR